jgi:hypothetical protein
MKAKRSNDYLIDWETHKTRRIGIAGVNLQDVCVTENKAQVRSWTAPGTSVRG